LNNPASALQRSASALCDAVSAWERQSATLDADEIRSLDGIRAELAARARDPRWIEPLARDALEREVAGWLATQSVDGGWKLAPLLVDAGWDSASLGQQISDTDPSHRPSLLTWLASGQQVHTLLHELTTSATTISQIVAGVKSYTRLDESPVQTVDINAGIDQALAMLRYKLRGISISRDIPAELPTIEANAVELNQVWTNLLDNAADALDGTGEITIRTTLDGDRIVVEISDTGPGIADDARPRLFEPFFSTKPPGKGLGLGLSISWSIIRRHDGELLVDSQPGRTTFTVRLPVDRERRDVWIDGPDARR
jgi:signal transduction histidine kinase